MASTRKESVTSLRFVTLSLRFSTAPYCFIRFFLPQLLTKSQFISVLDRKKKRNDTWVVPYK